MNKLMLWQGDFNHGIQYAKDKYGTIISVKVPVGVDFECEYPVEQTCYLFSKSQCFIEVEV